MEPTSEASSGPASSGESFLRGFIRESRIETLNSMLKGLVTFRLTICLILANQLVLSKKVSSLEKFKLRTSTQGEREA